MNAAQTCRGQARTRNDQALTRDEARPVNDCEDRLVMVSIVVESGDPRWIRRTTMGGWNKREERARQDQND